LEFAAGFNIVLSMLGCRIVNQNIGVKARFGNQAISRSFDFQQVANAYSRRFTSP